MSESQHDDGYVDEEATAYDGPEVEAALRRALDDRDRQVRQAAEDLLRP